MRPLGYLSLPLTLAPSLSSAPADPSAGYALYVPFSAADPTIRNGASTNTDWPTFIATGTYTRSGAKGELNDLAVPADVVNDFAANVPAIIPGVGYWSRGALTNDNTYSQDFSNAAWTKTNATISADALAAPDGTTTADTLTASAGTTEHRIYIATTSVAGTASKSVFAKAGTASFIALSEGAAANGYAVFDLATGGVSAVGGTGAGFITSLGGGWYRCTLVYTFVGATFAINIGSTAANAVPQQTWNAAGTETVHLWQAQSLLNGNHPAGGPIIATAGATASIGADALSGAWNPYTADADFIVSAMVDFPASNPAGNDTIFLLGANIMVYRSAADAISAFVPDAIASGVTVASGRAFVLIRRRAGKWTLLVKKTGGVATLSADTTVAWPATTSALAIGNGGGGGRLDGIAEHVEAKTGTFSDVEITAIADAAVT